MHKGPLIILNPSRHQILPLSTRAGTLLGHTSPLLVNGNMFRQFLQPACLDWHPPCVRGTPERGGIGQRVQVAGRCL